jgi:hypothetical protein
MCPLPPGAGALFWQPALSEGVNTDGLNIYLDGTLAVPPPEGVPAWPPAAARFRNARWTACLRAQALLTSFAHMSTSGMPALGCPLLPLCITPLAVLLYLLYLLYRHHRASRRHLWREEQPRHHPVLE